MRAGDTILSGYQEIFANQFGCVPSNEHFVPDGDFLSKFIEPSTPRYQHVLGVVHKMTEVLSHISFPEQLKHDLIITAYLHDIGYSEQIGHHRFHPLDGALFAHSYGFNKNIVTGIMFHSCAFGEALLRFPEFTNVYADIFDCLGDEELMFIDFITYCDMRTSPSGNVVTLDERISEVSQRYGVEHPVTKNLLLNRAYLDAVTLVVESRFEHQLV